jgi:DNA-binding CsgD family transcriptional regulator
MRAARQDVPVDDFATQLYRADDFVEIGRAVCGAARPAFGVEEIAIALHAGDGRPVISVDNLPRPHDQRLAYFDRGWRDDPLVGELRTGRTLARATNASWIDAELHAVALPITALPRLIGVIRCGIVVEPPDRQLAALAMMSTQVSVRLAQLGISPFSETGGALAPRALDSIRLVVDGLSNLEIADRLQISENTVKKYLKAAFEELQVANRTELAVRLARIGRRDSVPVGITRFADGCTVTKGHD